MPTDPHALMMDEMVRRAVPQQGDGLGTLFRLGRPVSPGPVGPPPGAPVRSWADARRDPLSALVEVLKGAVTGDAPLGPSAQGIGALLSAAMPFAKLGTMVKEGNAARGIKAYHGSPHDFDQFSLDKIGTGEGAQAYGHGLYFAEKEGTARAYRDALSKQDLNVGGKTIPAASLNTDESARDMAWLDLAQGRDNTETIRSGFTPRFADEYAAAIKQYRGQVSYAKPGHLYEVSIRANPEHLLDWDKPLSQQSEHVQRAAKATGGWVDPGPTGRTITGEDFVRGEREFAGAEAVSRSLNAHGIPGIKYLDGGSRASGTGSRNFVIFDDSLIDVLKKYGVALPAIEGLRQKAMSQGGTLPAADVEGLVS